MQSRLAVSLVRNRRRLVLVSFLAFVAGYVIALPADHGGSVLPLPVLAGLAYVAVISPTSLLVCVLLPSLRFMVEAMAFARLTVALFVASAPGAGMVLLSAPVVMASLTIAVAFLISRFMHGRPAAPAPRPEGSWIKRLIGPATAPPKAETPLQIRYTEWVEGENRRAA